MNNEYEKVYRKILKINESKDISDKEKNDITLLISKLCVSEKKVAAECLNGWLVANFLFLILIGISIFLLFS